LSQEIKALASADFSTPHSSTVKTVVLLGIGTLVPFTDSADLCPYRAEPASPHDGDVVYSDWLMAAVASYPTAPDDHLGTFLMALADLEEAWRSAPTSDADALLAYELAYDRALINLSQQNGIDTGPERFVVPERERERLHQALVEALPALPEVIFPPNS